MARLGLIDAAQHAHEAAGVEHVVLVEARGRRGLRAVRLAGRPRETPMPSEDTNRATRAAWRELGFHYDRDDDSKVWTLTGSRKGLLKFRAALLAYASNPVNARQSEHDHYGPYMYLKVMTWPEAAFDDDSIRGSLEDLRQLAKIIERKVASTSEGSSVRIREEFASNSPYTLVLIIRDDDFDPASADTGLPPEPAG